VQDKTFIRIQPSVLEIIIIFIIIIFIIIIIIIVIIIIFYLLIHGYKQLATKQKHAAKKS